MKRDAGNILSWKGGEVPQHIGNASAEAMPWTGRTRLFLSSRTELGKGLEKFIERHHAVVNTEKPLGLNTQRQMGTFLGRDLEKVLIHHGYQSKEVLRPLGARVFSSKDQIFVPRQNRASATTEGLGLLAHELTHVIQQTQPRRLLQRKVANQESTLIPAVFKKTNSDVVKAPPTDIKTKPKRTNIQRREEPAEVSEPASTQVSTEKRFELHPLNNVKEIADRVYRLMQRDLILDRERVNKLGG